MSILDLSYHLMYDLFSNKLHKTIWRESALYRYRHFTDGIKDQNIYKDTDETITEYDTSNYPKDYNLQPMDNQTVAGKM